MTICIRCTKFCTGALETVDEGRNKYCGLPRTAHIGNHPKRMNNIAKSYITAGGEETFAPKFHVVVYTVHIYQVICLKVVLIIRTISRF
jgi:hypothetical protein